MFKKLCTLGCLGFAALGLVSLPARADDATIQQSTQQTYIEGTGSSSTQINRQVSKTRNVRRGNRNHNTGLVQDTYQDSVVVGDDNDSYQYSEQRNVVETRNRGRGKKGGSNRIKIKVDD